MTRWLDPHPVYADSLSSLNLSPLIAQTLLRRGINSPEEAEAFRLQLISAGFPVVRRYSGGADIDAACGQLAARASTSSTAAPGSF